MAIADAGMALMRPARRRRQNDTAGKRKGAGIQELRIHARNLAALQARGIELAAEAKPASIKAARPIRLR